MTLHAWIACTIVGSFPVLNAQNPSPGKSIPVVEDRSADLSSEDERIELEERAKLASSRASEALRLENINFGEECVTVSEPSNRLLFQHEQNVNDFLAIGSKFGFGRALAVHMSNPHLATHGGVVKSLGFNTTDWSENGHSFKFARTWGLIGALDLEKPKAYLFRPSPYLVKYAKEKGSPKMEAGIEESALNRFEDHALSLLRKGEKLVRWDGEDFMHALGAIRAEAQCLRCHDNNKAGDLLGAFTYSFTKSKAVPPDEKTKQILTFNNEGKTALQIAEALGWIKSKQPGKFDLSRMYTVRLTLLEHGIVTAEMLADQARWRQEILKTDLGPVKKPHASAGAE